MKCDYVSISMITQYYLGMENNLDFLFLSLRFKTVFSSISTEHHTNSTFCCESWKATGLLKLLKRPNKPPAQSPTTTIPVETSNKQSISSSSDSRTNKEYEEKRKELANKRAEAKERDKKMLEQRFRELGYEGMWDENDPEAEKKRNEWWDKREKESNDMEDTYRR